MNDPADRPSRRLLHRFSGLLPTPNPSLQASAAVRSPASGKLHLNSLTPSTSAFSLNVPTGVTYSAASNVFLSAVPEPQTYALMLAGLVAVGGFVRRQRAAAGAVPA